MRAEKKLLESLSQYGLDLLWRFDLKAYNAFAELNPRLHPLEDFGHAHPRTYLLGNTRALWQPFANAYVDSAEIQKHADPLEHYIELSVNEVLEELDVRGAAFFGHESGDRLVSLTEAGRLTGEMSLGPAHLCVHSSLGSWFGLRAIIVLDIPSDEFAPRDPNLCDGCDAPCVTALEQARTGTTPPTAGDVVSNWREWVKVRTVCPLGEGSEYGPQQLEYHYTRRKSLIYPER